MRLEWKFWPIVAFTLLVAGCASKAPAPIVTPPLQPIAVRPTEAQEKLAFSFITYAGEGLRGSARKVERKLTPCIQDELDSQPLTSGNWDLVWGPVVFKFALAILDDNMMFVARNRHDPDHLVVAIRGTNTAILDWVEEDLDVFVTEAWAWGEPPAGLDPRISRATHRGLKILQVHTPKGPYGRGETIDEFLKSAVAQSTSGRVLIEVTGHSLAGALAPTLSLWLWDTRETWDPERQATLAVYAYAGATAGNADFATYSDKRIGAFTHRFHNASDVVPMAFERSTLEALPNLYGEVAPMPRAVKDILDGLLHLLEDRGLDYTQIKRDQPPIGGALMESETTFETQASWQHHCGYLCALEMNESFFQVSHKCKKQNPPHIRCPVCP